ncbi:MAG: 2-nitropropane dioxygenase, partial [Planctomycetes bacterium]|nr:2-nitropropane dioxygenase [Planctomycetota bacterium]
MNSFPSQILGAWSATDGSMTQDPAAVSQSLHDSSQPLLVVNTARGFALARGGTGQLGTAPSQLFPYPIVGVVAPMALNQLGDTTFIRDHGLRYAYVSGAMAAGIGSESIVEAMSRHGMLGFFGAAGLSPSRVESAIDRIQRSLNIDAFRDSGSANSATSIPSTEPLSHQPYGFNLIHSPNEQSLEKAIVDLYLRRHVPLVEASAYLDLTPHVVRYRLHGIHRDSSGSIVIPNRVVAKVSRIEVGAKFFAPAPAKILSRLIDEGAITQEQAQLAEQVPIAQDITAEADSGGHTDNRPALTLLPTIIALRDRAMSQYRFAQPLRVGAAGGISTPSSAAAAFAMGAAYILVGSVQQACIESGTCDTVRQMLAEAEQADTTMCPCADMFEMGVKV